MDTLAVAFAATCPVLLGNSSFSAFGFINVEVTRKNINNRKTMSVIDDIENDASTCVLLFMAMVQCGCDLFFSRFVQYVHKIYGCALHLENKIGDAGCQVVVSEICKDADYKSSDGGHHCGIYAS